MNSSHTQKYPNNCKAKTKDILGIGNVKPLLPSNYDLCLQEKRWKYRLINRKLNIYKKSLLEIPTPKWEVGDDKVYQIAFKKLDGMKE